MHKRVGGKRKLAPAIIEAMPAGPITRYAEVFAGGAALLCALADANRLRHGSSVMLNDTEPGIAAVFRSLRLPELLIERLTVWRDRYEAASLEDKEKLYYAARREWNDDNIPVDAATFIFLMQTAFNGLFRRNAAGKVNSAWGKSPAPQILDAGNIREWAAWAAARREFVVEQRDFRTLPLVEWLTDGEKPWSPPDPPGHRVVFFDPPYVETFGAYSADGFGHRDQIDVLLLLHDVRKAGATVVWSNSPAAEKLLPFIAEPKAVHHVDTNYSVNRDGGGRAGQKELLVVAPPIGARSV